jgi:hypothetical protein
MRWVEFHKLFVTPKSQRRETAFNMQKIVLGHVLSLVAHDASRSNVNSLVKAGDLRKLSAATLLPARLEKKALFL